MLILEIILLNANAFGIWFIILLKDTSEFIYDNPNEECLRICMKILVNDHWNLEWSLWVGIKIIVNNTCGGIPLSSYDNLGEECLIIGRTIVS